MLLAPESRTLMESTEYIQTKDCSSGGSMFVQDYSIYQFNSEKESCSIQNRLETKDNHLKCCATNEYHQSKHCFQEKVDQQTDNGSYSIKGYQEYEYNDHNKKFSTDKIGMASSEALDFSRNGFEKHVQRKISEARLSSALKNILTYKNFAGLADKGIHGLEKENKRNQETMPSSTRPDDRQPEQPQGVSLLNEYHVHFPEDNRNHGCLPDAEETNKSRSSNMNISSSNSVLQNGGAHNTKKGRNKQGPPPLICVRDRDVYSVKTVPNHSQGPVENNVQNSGSCRHDCPPRSNSLRSHQHNGPSLNHYQCNGQMTNNYRNTEDKNERFQCMPVETHARNPSSSTDHHRRQFTPDYNIPSKVCRCGYCLSRQNRTSLDQYISKDSEDPCSEEMPKYGKTHYNHNDPQKSRIGRQATAQMAINNKQYYNGGPCVKARVPEPSNHLRIPPYTIAGGAEGKYAEFKSQPYRHSSQYNNQRPMHQGQIYTNRASFFQAHHPAHGCTISRPPLRNQEDSTALNSSPYTQYKHDMFELENKSKFQNNRNGYTEGTGCPQVQLNVQKQVEKKSANFVSQQGLSRDDDQVSAEYLIQKLIEHEIKIDYAGFDQPNRYPVKENGYIDSQGEERQRSSSLPAVQVGVDDRDGLSRKRSYSMEMYPGMPGKLRKYDDDRLTQYGNNPINCDSELLIMPTVTTSVYSPREMRDELRRASNMNRSINFDRVNARNVASSISPYDENGILQHMMPGQDNTDTNKHIRETHSHSSVPNCLAEKRPERTKAYLPNGNCGIKQILPGTEEQYKKCHSKTLPEIGSLIKQYAPGYSKYTELETASYGQQVYTKVTCQASVSPVIDTVIHTPRISQNTPGQDTDMRHDMRSDSDEIQFVMDTGFMVEDIPKDNDLKPEDLSAEVLDLSAKAASSHPCKGLSSQNCDIDPMPSSKYNLNSKRSQVMHSSIRKSKGSYIPIHQGIVQGSSMIKAADKCQVADAENRSLASSMRSNTKCHEDQPAQLNRMGHDDTMHKKHNTHSDLTADTVTTPSAGSIVSRRFYR